MSKKTRYARWSNEPSITGVHIIPDPVDPKDPALATYYYHRSRKARRAEARLQRNETFGGRRWRNLTLQERMTL